MLEFIAGLVLGAILGVVADRLWQKIEQRPCISIQFGHFIDVEGAEGFALTVRNEGSTPIPASKPCIFNPKCGTFFCFCKEGSGGELLPKQEEKYRWTVLVNSRIKPHHPDFSVGKDGGPVSTEEEGYVLRIVLDKSDMVIYENRRVGRAFAKMMQKVCDQQGFGGSTGTEWTELHASPQGLVSWLWRLRKGQAHVVE